MYLVLLAPALEAPVDGTEAITVKHTSVVEKCLWLWVTSHKISRLYVEECTKHLEVKNKSVFIFNAIKRKYSY